MTHWYIPASSSLTSVILIAQSCSSGLVSQKTLWAVLFFSWSSVSLGSTSPLSRFQTTGGDLVSLEEKDWATWHGSVTSFFASTLMTCHSWKAGGTEKKKKKEFINWPLRLSHQWEVLTSSPHCKENLLTFHTYWECSAQPHTNLSFIAFLHALVLSAVTGIHASEVQDVIIHLQYVLLLCLSRREAPGVCWVSQRRGFVRNTRKGNTGVLQNSDVAGRQGKLKKREIVKALEYQKWCQ